MAEILTRVAYDLDGTILLSRYSNPFLKKLFFKENPDVDKPQVTTIITARTTEWAELTWLSCKLLGLTNLTTIIFNPESRWDIGYVASWKAQILMDYGFDVYIDNDVMLCSAIRNLGFEGVIKHV